MFHQRRLVLNCFNSWAATLCNFLGLDITDGPHAVVSDRVQVVVIGKEQRGQTARRHTHRETEERTTMGQRATGAWLLAKGELFHSGIDCAGQAGYEV